MNVTPPPPLVKQDDDPSLVNNARRRLARKSPLARLLSFPSLHSSPSFPHLNSTPDVSDTNIPINLDNSALIDQDCLNDRYEWAVLYENQRGQVLLIMQSQCLLKQL